MNAAFPRHARVRTGAEYARVFEQSRRCADPLLSLHWLAGEHPARLGMAVSRKVDTRAVGRNRIKRQLREQFRSVRPRLPGGDYVVVARPAARLASNAQLRETFLRVLARAGALPPTPAVGTMPAALNSPPSPSTTPEPDAG